MPAQSTPYGGQTTGPADDFKEKAAGQLDKFAERTTDKLRSVADQAEHFAGRVAEQGRGVGNNVQEVAGNLKGAVYQSVKQQPMATLAMAAVLGFVLGAVWKS
jgi:ElaB/YqjD/DUF883 family membrane-anchored ribosome-binding protein